MMMWLVRWYSYVPRSEILTRWLRAFSAAYLSLCFFGKCLATTKTLSESFIVIFENLNGDIKMINQSSKTINKGLFT